MKKSIEILIGEMEGKLGGYAALLNYRFLNLCVKAEPVALIPITIEDEEGEEQNLEDVAFAMLADDYTFEIIPKDQKLLFAICKGMMKDHPELKQEVITPGDDNKLDESDENEKHLLCRVPEVNQDRHDFLMDAVQVLYDQCKVELDKVNVSYTAKLTPMVVGLPEEDTDEAKTAMEDKQQTYSKMVDDYLAAKQKEIEDAYQKYLDEQATKKAAADEKAAARGETAGQQLRFDSEE